MANRVISTPPYVRVDVTFEAILCLMIGEQASTRRT